MSVFFTWVLAACPGVVVALLVRHYFGVVEKRRASYERFLDDKDIQQAYAKRERFRNVEEARQRFVLDRGPYVMPTAVLALATTVGVALSLRSWGLPLGLGEPFDARVAATSRMLLLGFGGALLWGLTDLVERMRALNLTPFSLHFLYLRLAVCAAVAPLLADGLKDGLSHAAAFAVGAFPTETLRRRLRAVLPERISADAAAQAEPPPKWEHVQGATPAVVERLLDAGITSVAHLAAQDPFSLLRRTNIEFRVLLDLIDQAILAGYLGEKIAIVRTRGVRGAIEMAVIGSRLDGEEDDDEDEGDSMRKIAEAQVKSLAAALDIPTSDLRALIQNLYEDAQVNLIWKLWFDDNS